MNKAILNECIALIANEIIKKANEPGGTNNADLRASIHSLGSVAATLGCNHHAQITTLAQNWLVRYERPEVEFVLDIPFIHPGKLNIEQMSNWLAISATRIKGGEARLADTVRGAEEYLLKARESLEHYRHLMFDTLTVLPPAPIQNLGSTEENQSV